MKTYKNLSEVAEAFKSGELSKDEWTLWVDNDCSHLRHNSDEGAPEDLYNGNGPYDIYDALGALGIPYEQV